MSANEPSLLQQFRSSSPFASGNAAFVEELYGQYLADPSSVSPEWRHSFDALKGREAGDQPHAAAIARIVEWTKVR